MEQTNDAHECDRQRFGVYISEDEKIATFERKITVKPEMLYIWYRW